MNTVFAQPSTSLQPAFPNPLAPKPVGAGAYPSSGAIAVGLAITIGGGIGGGLLGAKLSSKHKVGATIAGTLLGTVVVPMVLGPIFAAFAAGPAPAQPTGG